MCKKRCVAHMPPQCRFSMYKKWRGCGWALPDGRARSLVMSAVDISATAQAECWMSYQILAGPTIEESDIYAIIQSDIYTYVREMMLKFITGAADPETEWDDYMASIKDMAWIQSFRSSRMHWIVIWLGKTGLPGGFQVNAIDLTLSALNTVEPREIFM